MTPDSAAMGSAPVRRWERRLLLAGWLWGIGAFLGVAYWRIFAQFALHDDEGFCLMSLREFCRGGALYDEVYSVYQPFYHVFHWLVLGLPGVQLNHDNGRLLTIGLWLLGALITAAIGFRLSRSASVALAVLYVGCHGLAAFTNEPAHPQALAYVLVSAVALLVIGLPGSRSSRLPFGIGVALGLLVMTKINIGVYAAVPVALAMTVGLPPRWRGRLMPCFYALMVALPVALMRRELASVGGALTLVGACLLVALGWVGLRYARCPRAWGLIALASVLVGVGLVTVDRLAAPTPSQRSVAVMMVLAVATSGLLARLQKDWGGLGARVWAAVGAGFTLSVLSVATVVLLRGTSWGGLCDGMLWIPLAQSGVYSVPWSTHLSAIPLGVGAGVAMAAWQVWGNRPQHPSWLGSAIAVTKTVFGAAVVADFLNELGGSWYALPLPTFWMAPFAWLIAVQPRPARDGDTWGRAALALLAVCQPLVAYPVRGSQLAVGGMLLRLIGILVLFDVLHSLPQLFGQRLSWKWYRLLAAAAIGTALLGVWTWQAQRAWRRYYEQTPLALPGAARLRLPQEQVEVYRQVVALLNAGGADTFLTLPGMFSFYFWTERSPPTGLNVTCWMTLLSDEQQGRIVAATERLPGVVMAVRCRSLWDLWLQGRRIKCPLLLRYVKKRFVTLRHCGGYTVLVRMPKAGGDHH